MAETTITNLPNAAALTGSERVPMDQGGTTVDATTADIAATLPNATTSTAGKMTAAQATLLETALQPGQAIPSDVECRNNSGVGLTAGAPVYIVSSSGTKPTVALADASSEATAARSLGLVVATVGNNADCMVRTHGVLTGVNTATLTEGAAVWLSETTGQLTSTRPTQPAHGVFFGFCVKQAAGTAGILYVNVINGQELEELHDVLITGAPPATGAPRPALVRGTDGLWRDLLLTPGDVGAGTSNLAVGSTTPANLAATAAPGTSGEAARADHVHALPPVVSNAAAGLAPAIGTPSGRYLRDDATWATVAAGATPAGTATEIQYRDGAALGAIPNSAVDGTTGAVTLARLLLTANGAASAASLRLSGTWFTGGTNTTTFPQLLISPTGATLPMLNTAGTGGIINAPSGFTGDLFWLGVNGVLSCRITSAGTIRAQRFEPNANGGYIGDWGTNGIAIGGDNAPRVAVSSEGLRLGSNVALQWVNGANPTTNDLNTGIYREADDVLGQRNATTAQTSRIYNTFTSTTNFERAKIEWASNILRIGTEKGSGGGTARDMELQTDGTTRITLKAGGGIIFSGLPTTNPGVTGQLWNDAGTLKIS